MPLQFIKLLKIVQKTAPKQRYLLIEAVFFLGVARTAIRYIPFQQLTFLFFRPLQSGEVIGIRRRSLCAEVNRAINQAGKYISGGTVCFPRAVAAQAMLRRRRVGTTLYYGAAVLPEKGLVAHVWLQDWDKGVIGYRTAALYQVLACYTTSQFASPSDQTHVPH